MESRRDFFYGLSTILVCGFHAGCGEVNPKLKPPFRAEIFSSQDGEYDLRQVDFETLTDLRHMQGSLGSIQGNAAINVGANQSEVIASSDPDSLYLRQPTEVKTDYASKSGVAIPQSFASMEMMGLYFNYERTVLYWQRNFDLDFAAIPLPSILYNPSIISVTDGVEAEVSRVMNAAYLSGARDLWFLQSAASEHIPIKMNFAIIAHEFGHYIFDFQFAKFSPLTYRTVIASNRYLLNGINEGLADYFAYMVTGQTNEIAKSLPQLASERNLPVSWTLSSLPFAECRGGFYCEGSILASALHEISLAPGQTALSVGKKVFDALPKFYENWMAAKDETIVDYPMLLIPILDASGADKPLYCSAFLKWFDDPLVIENLPCGT